MIPAAEAGRFRLLRMRARDPQEPGRSATPLELFFDLVLVMAVVPVAALLVLLDPVLPFQVGVGAIILSLVVVVVIPRAPEEAHEHGRMEG